MFQHNAYRFSITVRAKDIPVLNCLRALADYSQQSGNKRIAWAGTTDTAWRTAGKAVTFHFSKSNYRDTFKAQAARILPNDFWAIVGECDDDPAVPQK
jgi:hypothetical protein